MTILKSNKELFKLSTIIVILSVFVLPGRVTNSTWYSYGYPFNFLTFYNDIKGDLTNFLISSFSINIILFLTNIFLIYSLLKIIIRSISN